MRDWGKVMRGTRLLLGLFVLPFGGGLLADSAQTRVTVSSQPSGATVIVDGQNRGITPMVLFGLTPGRHHVKYRLPGYVEEDQFFDTDEGPRIEKFVELAEEKGLLLIKTDPPDCDVQVSGVSVGRTPCLITHLAAKETYAVKLRKAGYLDQLISVKFEGRKPLVREEKMVLSSGTIDIQTEPAGAEVTVNGILRGKTPLQVKEVPKGRATVKFHLNGFADEVRELAINAGDTQTLSIGLKGLPGTLHLVSVPEGARFYVNGEPRGKGPLGIPDLKSGEYAVRAELEGYGTMEKRIRLANGESVREEFRLSNVMGRIEVRTCPPDTQVFLDGRQVGQTKSADPDAEQSDVLPIENVLEGEHVLVFRREGYSEATRHVRVGNSKTCRLPMLWLKRIFIPDVEIVTARGSYRGVLKANRADAVEIEVSLGITRSFPRDEIRKINFIKPEP